MAEIVGSRLQQLIADRGTSQSELARTMGISQPSVGRLISGETRETGKLLELARALRTTPEYLVGYSDDPDIGGAGGTPVSTEERELLDSFKRMEGRDRDAVLQIVRSLGGGRTSSTAKPTSGTERLGKGG